MSQIPIIAKEEIMLTERCPRCGGHDGLLTVDEARVRVTSCAECGHEIDVVDTFELAPPVDVIKIAGMDSYVCCGNCRTYHDGRWPCPHCSHTA